MIWLSSAWVEFCVQTVQFFSLFICATTLPFFFSHEFYLTFVPNGMPNSFSSSFHYFHSASFEGFLSMIKSIT